MRKPYVFKGKRPRQVEKAVFKEKQSTTQDLIERHGLELALEILEVDSMAKFLLYCNSHGIEQGGTKIVRPIHLTRGIKF